MVKHHADWNPEPTMSPRVRQRQMYVRRERIRKPMESQRGLVRDHAGACRPEPDGDQIFVLTCGEERDGQTVTCEYQPKEKKGPGVTVTFTRK